MVMSFGVLILAFVFFASVALGAATAWGIYALSRKRWGWLLTPVFAFFWLLLGTLPFTLLWSDARVQTPIVAPAPPVNSEPTEPEEEQVTESPEDAP